MMPTAIMALRSDGPRAFVTAIASSTPGKASIASTTRPSTWSTAPPIYPAARPIDTPPPRAMLTAMTATAIDTRVPYSTRASWSRPTLSAPSQWAKEGCSRVCAGAVWYGSYGVSSGAATPMSTMSAISPPKIIKRGSRRVRAHTRFARDRSASAVAGCVSVSAAACIVSAARPGQADARVEIRVGDVDDQVGEQEQEHRQEHDGLDGRVIAGAQRLESQTTDAGPRKDKLDDEGAFENGAKLEAQQRDAGISAFRSACRRMTAL